MSEDYSAPTPEQRGLIGRLLYWCLTHRLVVGLAALLLVAVGLAVSPLRWRVPGLPRRPVATDAIPDLGENQQIVFTQWMGRSPRDVEDQITYPLTAALRGVPGVKTIRSLSMFGFSTIYVIFEESMDFYDARTRILEKLGSLQPGRDYPEGTRPRLGPDATALGQIFWYTLEGRDPLNAWDGDEYGNPVGGWDLEELRTIQDWTVRYTLMSAEGVSEVASVGGFVREYQVDVDPDAMRAYDVTLPQVVAAVRGANLDVGARTLEINRMEYFIRGIGFIKNVEDIERSVVKVVEDVPVLVRHVATVSLGPALRRGALDKDGAEAVGGVVVARYGVNPLATIGNVKDQIDQLAPSLPAKVVIDDGVPPERIEAFARARGFAAYEDGELNHGAWVTALRGLPSEERPAWARVSQVTIVPFYDRTGLIHETLGTLDTALTQEMLITFVVVILMVLQLRSSFLIGGMLPMAVLLCFIAMKAFGVDANIVALSGIAIAIGTIVDMGIVVTENILRHLDEAPPEAPRLQVVHRAASEVGAAVLTAVATTVVSFLPVFFMIGAEGKLFRPLAFTKTFVLIASILIALTLLPPAAHIVLCGRVSGRKLRAWLFGALAAAGAGLAAYGFYIGSGLVAASGAALGLFGLYRILEPHVPVPGRRWAPLAANLIVAVLVGVLLAIYWEPLGPGPGMFANVIFVAVLVGGLLGFFRLVQWVYPSLLRGCLAHKVLFLCLAAVVLFAGVLAWRGFDTAFGGAAGPETREHEWWVGASQTFPGLGQEFMPDLDEGAFLFMPTTMVHASIGEALDIVSKQDRAFEAIPEIDSAVGKIGRAETPLDPAPISMIETVINYKSEYKEDGAGNRIRFRLADEGEPTERDATGREFALDEEGELIPDDDGALYRQWRPGIRSPDDMWNEIVAAGQIPGTTAAPKLMPIKARLVMLQSGMRAPMGVKIKGPDLKAIERVGLRVEELLKQVPGVDAAAVTADRIVAKPYLEIVPDRLALSRYGVKIREFQDVVEIAIGGRPLTQTIEGRERFPVRVRYPRELRDSVEALGRVLVPGAEGAQVPLSQVADIRFVIGPQVIKSEDAFLTSYVLFDKLPGEAETDVVERAQAFLAEKRESGEFAVPAGVRISFAGNYENQVRSRRTLMIVLPFALLLIFLILYFQFHSVSATLIVFSGIFVAWAGGFLLLWAYGKPWFLDFSVFGVSMRDLFQVHTMNLSVAVWVGFLALFGIATDNGVIQTTYLRQVFRDRRPGSREEVREATVVGAVRRIRPCLMTTATTILALLPVLASTGRGSDVMVPMAIPSFGGMLMVLLTVFVVPVLYCWVEERKVRRPKGPGA